MSADAYTKPYRETGRIHFSMALQDGTRQPWAIRDTVSNWHFAWWIHVCDRPIPEKESPADTRDGGEAKRSTPKPLENHK